jgi:hypothetical protein
MTPDLAQVLNTLAHEIRTPLAVSQGYLKLFLDGRLKDADETRKAMEQTRQALGALATYCMDMGKISALAEGGARGIPSRLTATDLVMSVREHSEVRHATFSGSTGTGQIESPSARDLAYAVAIVARSAFDEAREHAHAVETRDDSQGLYLLAGAADVLPVLRSGPGAPNARPVDFGKGGKGLKLIWAAFVLDRHGVETWTDAEARATVGLRIPMVQA